MFNPFTTRYFYRVIGIFAITFATTQCIKSSSQSDSGAEAGLLLLAQSSSINQPTGCPPNKLPDSVYIANEVVSAPGSGSGSFKDANKAINGICGGGQTSGSLNVYSLDATGPNASIILTWKDKKVQNVLGVDFTVFENPFQNTASGNAYFLEPLIVEVSENNTEYCGFSPTHLPVATDTRDDWKSYAGLTPVLYNMETNPIAPDKLFDSATKQPGGKTYYMGRSGGDGFDLDDLATGADCDSTAVSSIRTNGFRYIRLTSATDRDAPAVPGSLNGGPDIDGVIARSVSNFP